MEMKAKEQAMKPKYVWLYTPNKWGARLLMSLARHDNQPDGFLSPWLWAILK